VSKLRKILITGMLSLVLASPSFALKNDGKGFNGYYVGAAVGFGKSSMGITKEATDDLRQQAIEKIMDLGIDPEITVGRAKEGFLFSVRNRIPAQIYRTYGSRVVEAYINDFSNNIQPIVDYFGEDTTILDATDNVLSKLKTNNKSFTAELVFGFDKQFKSNLILGFQVGFGKNFGSHKITDIEIIKDITKFLPESEQNFPKYAYKNKLEVNLRPMIGFALGKRFALGLTPGINFSLDEIAGAKTKTVRFMPGLRMVFKATDSLEIGAQAEMLFKAKIENVIEKKPEVRGSLSINYRF